MKEIKYKNAVICTFEYLSECIIYIDGNVVINRSRGGIIFKSLHAAKIAVTRLLKARCKGSIVITPDFR